MENKFKIFVIVALVFLGVSIAGSTFFILSVVKSKDAASTTQVESNEEYSNLAIVALADSITTNIYEDGNKQHIARVQVSFGVAQEPKKEYSTFTTAYGEKTAVIRNEVIQVLREQTYSMMVKPDAQVKLSDEIATRINSLLETSLIKEVYFEEFFVQ